MMALFEELGFQVAMPLSLRLRKKRIAREYVR